MYSSTLYPVSGLDEMSITSFFKLEGGLVDWGGVRTRPGVSGVVGRGKQKTENKGGRKPAANLLGCHAVSPFGTDDIMWRSAQGRDSATTGPTAPTTG